KSLVLAALKDAGLAVYDLNGARVQHISAPPAPGENDQPGRLNNVDVVYGLGGLSRGRRTDLAVVTDRGRDQLRFYRIDPDADGGPLVDVTAAGLPFIFSADQEQVNEELTAYGVAATRLTRIGPGLAFVTQ